jgi:hypothetical protein
LPACYGFWVRLSVAFVMLLAVGCSSPGVPATSDDGGSDAGPRFCLTCDDATSDAPLAVRAGWILGICAGDDCHNHGQGRLVIAGVNDFSSLINVLSWEVPSLYRVKPGDPAQSYVYLKMACEGGIVGECMPLGHPYPGLAQVVHDWIEAGAPMQ